MARRSCGPDQGAQPRISPASALKNNIGNYGPGPEEELNASIINISDADYYADKYGPVPNLHYSTAAKLVNQSPLHAHASHARLGGQKSDPTSATDDGTVMHSLLLEAGAGLEVVHADNYQTKAAKEARDAARAAGKTPVIAHRLEELMTAAEAIRHRMREEFGVVLDGQSEVPVWWREATQLGPISCLAKLDHLKVPDIFDLKTTSGEVSVDACQRRIYDHGYDIQAAAYTSAVEKVHPELAGRVRFVFLFVELDPPYAVTPLIPSGTLKQLGEQRWRRACETWARCLTLNKWPGHVTELTRVEALPWALAKEMEHGSNV